MTLDLTDDEAAALRGSFASRLAAKRQPLVAHLRDALEYAPFPFAPRLNPLKAILAKLTMTSGHRTGEGTSPLEPPAPQVEPPSPRLKARHSAPERPAETVKVGWQQLASALSKMTSSPNKKLLQDWNAG